MDTPASQWCLSPNDVNTSQRLCSFGAIQRCLKNRTQAEPHAPLLLLLLDVLLLLCCHRCTALLLHVVYCHCRCCHFAAALPCSAVSFCHCCCCRHCHRFCCCHHRWHPALPYHTVCYHHRCCFHCFHCLLFFTAPNSLLAFSTVFPNGGLVTLPPTLLLYPVPALLPFPTPHTLGAIEVGDTGWGSAVILNRLHEVPAACSIKHTPHRFILAMWHLPPTAGTLA